MANNLFLMGFIIFLSDIYIYMYRWFLKNVDNINQKSNKKKLTYLMDHKKKETWKRMDKFFLECILVY